MGDDQEPTQQTRPKGIGPKTGKPYEPIDILVPKRSLFDRLLGRAEKTYPSRGPGTPHPKPTDTPPTDAWIDIS